MRDKFPRNFLVANAMRNSPTCYEDTAIALATFSTCEVGLACRLTYPQQLVRVELVQFSERHDKRTNGQHYRSRPPAVTVTRKSPMLRGCYDLSGASLACYEKVNDKLRTYYEEITRKLVVYCTAAWVQQQVRLSDAGKMSINRKLRREGRSL